MPGARAELARVGHSADATPRTAAAARDAHPRQPHRRRGHTWPARHVAVRAALPPPALGALTLPNRLYSGMPSQDAQPDSTQYAYPAYWAANFTRRAAPRLHLHRCAC